MEAGAGSSFLFAACLSLLGYFGLSLAGFPLCAAYLGR